MTTQPPGGSWRFENLPRPTGSAPGAHGSLDDPTLSCLHPATAELVRYWKSLQPAGRLPSRADLDPADMRRILSHLLLLEVNPAPAPGPHVYRFRLLGTESTLAYGPSTGRRLDEVLDAAALERHLWVLERVVNEAAPLRNIGRALRPNRDWLITEAVAMPLAHAQQVNMVLAAVVRWPEDNPPAPVREAWLKAAQR